VWGGGLMAAPLAAKAGLSQGRGGRIDVRPDLTVEGYPGVYALGDFANIPFGDDHALPQLGSVAQQAGDWAGRNILADVQGEGRQSFHYHDKGIMAMIGRKAAVAEVGEHRHELHGRIAFAAWLGVHAQLLANAGAEANAFLSWADEFYLRSHHRSAELLDPLTIDTPRIDWSG
jgi:NADH:ubiquinone reductase (H+-translocating)